MSSGNRWEHCNNRNWGRLFSDLRDKLIAQGAVPQASTPAELQALIDADRARYGKIIRDKGLKAE